MANVHIEKAIIRRCFSLEEGRCDFLSETRPAELIDIQLH